MKDKFWITHLMWGQQIGNTPEIPNNCYICRRRGTTGHIYAKEVALHGIKVLETEDKIFYAKICTDCCSVFKFKGVDFEDAYNFLN